MKRILPFLLFICGCQSHSQWQAQQVKSEETLCSRLAYSSKDPTAGIDMELLQYGSELVAYLQVSGQLTPNKKGKVEVTLTSDSTQVTYKLPCREGKQRLKLSREAIQTLIAELEKHPTLTLELPGYRETLEKEEFQKALKKLRKGPSFLKVNVL